MEKHTHIVRNGPKHPALSYGTRKGREVVKVIGKRRTFVINIPLSPLISVLEYLRDLKETGAVAQIEVKE
ncbi:MAG TPA: hypothetical protein VHD32_13520 [Candidatus Didemnitutus sp.]|nr:hypothetical protein [Candidatus Didemnitutus sp.]